jgi:hypothetical protein
MKVKQKLNHLMEREALVSFLALPIDRDCFAGVVTSVSVTNRRSSAALPK